MPKALVVGCVLLFSSVATANECVILMHGMLRSSSSMEQMADAIETAGYTAVNLD